MNPSPKLCFAIALPLLFSACGTMAPPKPPSLDLPTPPKDLHAVRKGDRVILTWTVPDRTTDRQIIHRVGPTQICRGAEAELTKCGTPVAEPKPEALASKSASEKSSSADHKSPQKLSTRKSAEKTTASYTDTLPNSLLTNDPATAITYAIEVLNENGHGSGLSNQIRVPTIRTLPPPQDFTAHVTSQGIVLTWTIDLTAASTNGAYGRKFVYRISRRQEGSNEAVVVASVPIPALSITSIPPMRAPSLSFTDSNFEWEKTYYYRAEIATVIAQPGKPESPVEGADTPEVQVFADDVFPPAVPSGLQAVFSGPGQPPFVDLIWAPVTDMDLNGYNVYRREEGTAAVKINRQTVKTPAFRDQDVAPGKTYFYAVSAVDVRGNESARSDETSERVP